MIKHIWLIALCCTATFVTAQHRITASNPVHTKHYINRVAYFDSLPPIKRCNTVMLGNSLIEFGGNWNKILKGKEKGNYINRGIMGDDAMGICDRLYQILPAHPKKIFLIAGINDISHQLPADSVATLVTKLIEKIQTDSPQTKLYLQSLLPINENFHRYKTMDGKTEVVCDVNKKLRQIADSHGITFINLFPLFTVPGTHILRPELSIDGLHLKPAGYEIWSKALQKYL